MSYVTWKRPFDTQLPSGSRVSAYPPLPLVFLDRDGVINQSPGQGWVTHPQDLQLQPRAAAALRQLNAQGTKVVIITNQSCIGRGVATLEAVEAVHQALHQLLLKQDAYIDAIYMCPDYPGPGAPPSPHRKPAPGLLIQALADYGLPNYAAPFVGDSWSDLQAAWAAGCVPHLVATGHGQKTYAGFLQEQQAHPEQYRRSVPYHTDLHAAVMAVCPMVPSSGVLSL